MHFNAQGVSLGVSRPEITAHMILRVYEKSDARALDALYRDAVETFGKAAYTPEQVRAWAMFPEDIELFRDELAHGTTLVGMGGSEYEAFGQLNPIDHIAYLFTSPRYAYKGCATVILERLEAVATLAGVLRLRVEASKLARTLFEKRGYQVTLEDRPVSHGVEMVRYEMIKTFG